MDSSKLEIICDLVDGDKVRESIILGKEIGDLSTQCVIKSVEMINRMEEGVRSLPDFMEEMIDDQIMRSSEKENEENPITIEKDIEDIEKCVIALKTLNLSTAMSTGLNSYQTLAQKAQVCGTLFEAIEKFSTSVMTITDAFISHDWGTAAKKLKDIFRCIKLSKLIKKYAEEAGKLMKHVINLFQDSSRGLGVVWKALDFAKNCLSECLCYIKHVKQNCSEAISKSELLIETSKKVNQQLNMRSMNTKSITSMATVLKGDDIQRAIDLATDMDDILRNSTEEVVSMIDKVTGAYDNLPAILRDGIDMEEAGKIEDEPMLEDLERHLGELSKSRSVIEDADVFTSIQASEKGFSSIADKTELCKKMLCQSEEFANKSIITIESFMGVWDFDIAIEKIMDICRLVTLGEILKQFAEQVMQILISMIELMNATICKLQSLSPSDLKEGLDNVVNTATEMIDSFTKFWK